MILITGGIKSGFLISSSHISLWEHENRKARKNTDRIFEKRI